MIHAVSAEDPRLEPREEDLKIFKIDFKGVWTQYQIAQITICYLAGGWVV